LSKVWASLFRLRIVRASWTEYSLELSEAAEEMSSRGADILSRNQTGRPARV